MSLILPILIFAIFYFFIIRPKQAKLRAAQAEQQQFVEGDRVMSRSGIYGRVNRISQDLAVVEVAPGIELVFDRRSVVKAPESVDVDLQNSGDSLSSGFSEEDFSELHDHLESHATDHGDIEPDDQSSEGEAKQEDGQAHAEDEEIQKGDEDQH